MKADPFNIAIVFLVFMNALALVQFQALARTTPWGVSKISMIESAKNDVLDVVRY